MTATKKAWARIREQYEKAMAANEGFPYRCADTPSINDSIQAEYLAGRVTEEERDAMRAYTREWLPDWEPLEPATYSGGRWVPSVRPMGFAEHAIILATVQILEEEAE